MKTRSIKELLIFLKDNKDYFNESRCGGLCIMANWLRMDGKILDQEHEDIVDYFNINLPPHTSYTAYCWSEYDWTPRLEWLNEHIKQLNK